MFLNLKYNLLKILNKIFLLSIPLSFLFVNNLYSQVGVGLDKSRLNDSALLEIKVYDNRIEKFIGVGLPIFNFPDTPTCNSLTDGMMFYDTIQKTVFVCSNNNWNRLFNSDTRAFKNFNFKTYNLTSSYAKGGINYTDTLKIYDTVSFYGLPVTDSGDSLVVFSPKLKRRLNLINTKPLKITNIAAILKKYSNAQRKNFYNIDSISLNHLMVLLRDSLGVMLSDTLFLHPDSVSLGASILRDSVTKRLTPDSVLTINKNGYLEWKNISAKVLGAIQTTINGLRKGHDTVLLGGNLSNFDTTKLFTNNFNLSFIQKINGGLFLNNLINGSINDSLLVKQNNILKLIHPFDFFTDTADIAGILLKGNSARFQNILKLDTLKAISFLKNTKDTLQITRRDSALTLEKRDTVSLVAFTSLKSKRLNYLHNKSITFTNYQDTLKLSGKLEDNKSLNLINNNNFTLNVDKAKGGYIKLNNLQKQINVLDKMNPRDSVLIKDIFGNIKKIARWDLITDTLGLKYTLKASENGNIADSQSIFNLDTLYTNNIKILRKENLFHIIKDSLLTLDNNGVLSLRNISSNVVQRLKRAISGVSGIKDTIQLGGLIIDTASINIGDIDFVFSQNASGKIKLDNLYNKISKGNGLDTVLIITTNGELKKIRSSDLKTDTPGIAGILKIGNNANHQNLLNLDSITLAKIKFTKTNLGNYNITDSVITLSENGELAWLTLKPKKYYGRNGLKSDLDTIKLGGRINYITIIPLDSFTFNLNSKKTGSKIYFNNLKDLDKIDSNDSVLTVSKDGEVRSIWRGELSTNIPNIVGILKVGNNANDSSLYAIDTIGFSKGIIRNIINIISYGNNTDDSVLILDQNKYVRYRNITKTSLNYLMGSKNGISTELKNDTISLGGKISNNTNTIITLDNYNLIFNANIKGSNVFENVKSIDKLSDLNINDSILMISSDGKNALKKISRKDLLTDTFSLNNILKFSRIYADSQNIEMLDSFSFKSLFFKYPEFISEFNNNNYLHTDSVLMIDTLGRFVWKDVRKIKPPKKLIYVDGIYLYGTYLDTIMLGGNVPGTNPILYIDQNYDLVIEKNKNGNFKLQNISVDDANYVDDSVLTLYSFNKIGTALPNQIQIDTPSIAAYINKYNKIQDKGGNFLGIDTLFTNKFGISGKFKENLPVLIRDSILVIDKNTGKLSWREVTTKNYRGLNGLTTNSDKFLLIGGNSNLDTIKFNLDSSNMIFKRSDQKGDLKLSGLNLYNPNDKNFVYLIDSADRLEMVRSNKLQTKITGIAGVLMTSNDATGRDIKSADTIGLRIIKFKNFSTIKNSNRQDSILTLSKIDGSLVYKNTNYLNMGYYRGAKGGITKMDSITVSLGGKFNEDIVYKLDSLSFLELKLDGNTTKKGTLKFSNIDTTTNMNFNALTLTAKQNFLEQSFTHDVLTDTPDIYGVLRKSINGGSYDFRIDTIELNYWRDTIIDKHSYNRDSILTIGKDGYLKWRNITAKRTGIISNGRNGLYNIDDTIFLGGKLIFDSKIELNKYNFEIKNNGGNIVLSGLRPMDSIVQDTSKLLMISGNGVLRQAYPWDLYTDTSSLGGLLIKDNNAKHTSLNTGKGLISLKSLIFDTSFNKWNFGLNVNDTVLALSKDGKFGRKKLKLPHRYVGKNGLSYIQGPIEGHDTLIFGGKLTQNTLINLNNYAWGFKAESINKTNGLRFNNIPLLSHTKNDSILLMDTSGFLRVVFAGELITDTPGIKAVLTKSRDAKNESMRNIDTLFLNKFIFRNAYNIGKIGVRDSALTIDSSGNVRFVDITSIGLGYTTISKRGINNKRDTALLGGSLTDSIMLDLASNNLIFDRNKTKDFKFISSISFNTNADSVLILDPISNALKTVHRFNVTTDTPSIAGPLFINNNARNYNIYNLDTISARSIKMLQIDSIYSYVSDTFLILDGKGIVRQVFRSYNDTTNIKFAYNGLSPKKDTLMMGGEIIKLVSIKSLDTSDILFNFSKTGSLNLKNVQPLKSNDINGTQYGIAINHIFGELNPIHPFSMITDTPNIKGVLVKDFNARNNDVKNVGILNITNSVQLIDNNAIVSESNTDSVLVYDSKNKGVIFQKSNVKDLGLAKISKNGIIRKDTNTVMLGGNIEQNTEFILKNQLKFNLNNKQQIVFNDLDTSIKTNNIIIIDTLTNQLYQIVPSNLRTKTQTIAGVLKINADANTLSIKNLDSISFGTLKVDISKISNFKDYFLNPDTVFDDHILTANPKTNSLAYTSISHFRKNQKSFKSPLEVSSSIVNLNGSLDSTRELNLNGYPFIFEQYSTGKLKFDLLKSDTLQNQMVFIMDSIGNTRYLYSNNIITDTVEFAGIILKSRNAQKQSFLNLDTVFTKNIKFETQKKLNIDNSYTDTMLSLDQNNFIIKRRPNFVTIDSVTNGLKRINDTIYLGDSLVYNTSLFIQKGSWSFLLDTNRIGRNFKIYNLPTYRFVDSLIRPDTVLLVSTDGRVRKIFKGDLVMDTVSLGEQLNFYNRADTVSSLKYLDSANINWFRFVSKLKVPKLDSLNKSKRDSVFVFDKEGNLSWLKTDSFNTPIKDAKLGTYLKDKRIISIGQKDKLNSLSKTTSTLYLNNKSLNFKGDFNSKSNIFLRKLPNSSIIDSVLVLDNYSSLARVHKDANVFYKYGIKDILDKKSRFYPPQSTNTLPYIYNEYKVSNNIQTYTPVIDGAYQIVVGGAGGAAAISVSGGTYQNAGGGGGGAYCIFNNIPLKKGSNYNIYVGKGANSLKSNNIDGGDGDSSYFELENGVRLIAKGGKGGISSTATTNVITGGDGGSCYILGNYNAKYVKYIKGRNGCTYNLITAKCNFDIPTKDSTDATGILSTEILSVDSVYYGSGGGACNQSNCFYGYGKHAAQAYVSASNAPPPNYVANLDSAYAYHGGGGGVYFGSVPSNLSVVVVRKKMRGADGVVAVTHSNTGVTINALDTVYLKTLKINTANIGNIYSDSILVYDKSGSVFVVNKNVKPVVEAFSGLQKTYDNGKSNFELGGKPVIKEANLSFNSNSLRFLIGDTTVKNAIRFTGLDTFNALSVNRKNAIIIKNNRGHLSKVEYSAIPALFNINLKTVIKRFPTKVGDTLSFIRITNLLMDTTRKNDKLKLYDSINQIGIKMSVDTNYYSKDYINDAVVSNKMINIGRELFVNADSSSNDSIFKHVLPYKITNFWPNNGPFLYQDSVIITANNYNFIFPNWTAVTTTRQLNTNVKYSYIPRINNFQYIINTAKQTNTSYSTLKNRIDRPNPKFGVVSCKYPYFETSNFSNDCDLIGTQLSNTTNSLERKYYFYFDSTPSNNIEDLNYLSLEFKASNDTLYYKTSNLFKKDTSIFKRAGYPLCTSCLTSAGNDYRYLLYSAFENNLGNIQSLGNRSPKSIKVRLDIPSTKIIGCNINEEFEVSLSNIYPFSYLGSSLYSNPNKLFDGIKDRSFGVCMARGDSLTNVGHYNNEGQKYYNNNEKSTKFGPSSFGFSVSLVKNGNKNILYTLDTLRIYKSNTIKTFTKEDNELQLPYKEIYAFSVDLNGKIDSLGDLGECKSSTLCEFVRPKSDVPVVEIAIVAFDYKTSKSYNIKRASNINPKFVSDSLVNAPINRQGFFINEIEPIGREIKAKNSKRTKFITEFNTYLKLKNLDSVKLDPNKDFIVMIDASNNLFKINTQSFAKNQYLNYDSTQKLNIQGPVLSDVLIAGNTANYQSVSRLGIIRFDSISKLNQIGNNKITPQVYTSNLSFTVTSPSSYDLLLVAGGGAGGTGRTDKISVPGSTISNINILKGSGGSGGGFIELNNLLLPAGNYSIKVGSGGKVGSGILNVNNCGSNTNGGDGDSTELKGDNGVRIVVYGGKGGLGCESTTKSYRSTGLAKWEGINITNSNINFLSNSDTVLKRGNCGFNGINCGGVTSLITGDKYASGGNAGLEYSTNCDIRPNLLEGKDGYGSGGQGGYGGTCNFVATATPYLGWVGTRGGNGVFAFRPSGKALSDPVLFYSNETDAVTSEEVKKKFSYLGMGTQTNINKASVIDSTVNYLRTMSNFAVYQWGNYNYGSANPGNGGTVQFFIDGFKRRMGIGTVRPQSIIHLNSEGTNDRARVNTTVHSKKFKHSLLTFGVDTNGDLLVGLDSGANDITYDTITLTGGGIFTLPNEINSFYAIIIGGGGGSSKPCNTTNFGGAGGGGAVRTEYITGNYGASYKYKIGVGGTGAISNIDGNSGESTYIGSYEAKGGGGGTACSPNGGSGGLTYYGDQTKYYYGAINNKVELGVNYYAGTGAGAGGKGSLPENGKGITLLGREFGKGGNGGNVISYEYVNELGSGANAVPLESTTGLDGANGGIIVIYKRIKDKRISLNVNQFKNRPFSPENSSNSDFQTTTFKIDENLSTTTSLESTYSVSANDANDFTYDILVVGGGGGGAISGSAGGGGAVYEALNVSLPPGTYNIKVGKGGQSAYSILYNSNFNNRVNTQNSCNTNSSPNGLGATDGLLCRGDSSRISAVIGGINYSIVAPGGSGGIGYAERSNVNVTTDRNALKGGNGGSVPIVSTAMSSLVFYKTYSSTGRNGGGGLCDGSDDDWCYGQNGYRSFINGQYYGSGGGGGTSSSSIPFNGGTNAGKSALNLGANNINFMDKINNGESDAINGYGGGASGGSLNQIGGFSKGGGGIVIIRKRPKLFYKVYTTGSYNVSLKAGNYNILVVGGGGGGANSGGGGGAVYEALNVPLPAGTYSLSVGAGGKSVRAIDPTQSGYQSCNVAALGTTNGNQCNGQASSISATIEGTTYSITANGGSGGNGWNERIDNNYNNNNGNNPNGSIPGGAGGSAPIFSSQIKSVANPRINSEGRVGGEGLCSPSTGKWCNGKDGYLSSITGKIYGSSGAGQSDDGNNSILPSFIGGVNAGNGGRRNNVSLLETDGVEGTGGGAGGGGIDRYGGLTVAGSGIIVIQEVTKTSSDYSMDYGNLTINESKIYNQYLLATGTTLFEVTNDMYDFQIFAVGGGGGGSVECGSGGGGGGVFEGSGIALVSGIYTVNVGQGGNGGVLSQGGSGSYGGNTSISGNGINIAAIGGDGGKSRLNGTCASGVKGGKIIYSGLINGINIFNVNASSNTITGQNSSDFNFPGLNGVSTSIAEGVYGSSGGGGGKTTFVYSGGTNAGSGSISTDCTPYKGLDEFGGGGGGGGLNCTVNALSGGDGVLYLKYKRIGYGTYITKFTRSVNQTFVYDQKINNLTILVVGGGGGGAANSGLGGAGGGVAYGKNIILPYGTLNLKIGDGGLQGNANINGYTGGTSSVSNLTNTTTYISATGGSGGISGPNQNNTNSGGVGSFHQSVSGDILRTYTGGGGGLSASSTGTSGSNGNQGVIINGIHYGPGGGGGSFNNTYVAKSGDGSYSYGAGGGGGTGLTSTEAKQGRPNVGGGGGSANSDGSKIGAKGGSGQILISYNQIDYELILSQSDTNKIQYLEVTNRMYNFEILAVGGGGSGGDSCAGGGGGGGIVYVKGLTLTPGKYRYALGSGGLDATNNPSNDRRKGNDTYFYSETPGIISIYARGGGVGSNTSPGLGGTTEFNGTSAYSSLQTYNGSTGQPRAQLSTCVSCQGYYIENKVYGSGGGGGAHSSINTNKQPPTITTGMFGGTNSGSGGYVWTGNTSYLIFSPERLATSYPDKGFTLAIDGFGGGGGGNGGCFTTIPPFNPSFFTKRSGSKGANGYIRIRYKVSPKKIVRITKSTSFNVTADMQDIDILVVGAGGGGGGSGGGGAGGSVFEAKNVSLPIGGYNVIIGSKGLGGGLNTGNTGNNGTSTSMSTIYNSNEYKINSPGGNGGGGWDLNKVNNSPSFDNNIPGGTGGGLPTLSEAMASIISTTVASINGASGGTGIGVNTNAFGTGRTGYTSVIDGNVYGSGGGAGSISTDGFEGGTNAGKGSGWNGVTSNNYIGNGSSAIDGYGGGGGGGGNYYSGGNYNGSNGVVVIAYNLKSDISATANFLNSTNGAGGVTLSSENSSVNAFFLTKDTVKTGTLKGLASTNTTLFANKVYTTWDILNRAGTKQIGAEASYNGNKYIPISTFFFRDTAYFYFKTTTKFTTVGTSTYTFNGGKYYDFIVVGGGGASQNNNGRGAGGGGGGIFYAEEITFPSGLYKLIVGAGGTATQCAVDGPCSPSNGSASYIQDNATSTSIITANGGGGSWRTQPSYYIGTGGTSSYNFVNVYGSLPSANNIYTYSGGDGGPPSYSDVFEYSTQGNAGKVIKGVHYAPGGGGVSYSGSSYNGEGSPINGRGAYIVNFNVSISSTDGENGKGGGAGGGGINNDARNGGSGLIQFSNYILAKVLLSNDGTNTRVKLVSASTTSYPAPSDVLTSEYVNDIKNSQNTLTIPATPSGNDFYFSTFAAGRIKVLPNLKSVSEVYKSRYSFTPLPSGPNYVRFIDFRTLDSTKTLFEFTAIDPLIGLGDIGIKDSSGTTLFSSIKNNLYSANISLNVGMVRDNLQKINSVLILGRQNSNVGVTKEFLAFLTPDKTIKPFHFIKKRITSSKDLVFFGTSIKTNSLVAQIDTLYSNAIPSVAFNSDTSLFLKPSSQNINNNYNKLFINNNNFKNIKFYGSDNDLTNQFNTGFFFGYGHNQTGSSITTDPNIFYMFNKNSGYDFKINYYENSGSIRQTLSPLIVGDNYMAIGQDGKTAQTSTDKTFPVNLGSLNVTSLTNYPTLGIYTKNTSAYPRIELKNDSGTWAIGSMINTSASKIYNVINNSSNYMVWQYKSSNQSNYTAKMVQGVDLIYGVGGIWLQSGIITPSDERIKTNIITLDSSLKKIMNLRGVKYKWKMNPNSETYEYGYIAQEVEKIYPEFITSFGIPYDNLIMPSDDLKYKTILFNSFTAITLEAIKEQHRKYLERNNKIDILKTNLLQQKDNINKIKDY